MKKKIIFYFSIILILGSCYPQGPEYYEDLDLVYTNYDDQYDFASKGSFAIPDKIVKVTGDLIEGEDPEFVDDKYAGAMLQKMIENMEDLGWTETDDSDNADVVLLPAVWSNTTIYYWYDYWCWYAPWYCGWGWGYPSVSSYTTGTLVMTLVADGDDYIDPARVWTAAANGLLSGAVNISRVNTAIDQAFEQSPYLNTNSR
jgi:hypothetical protein